MELDVQLFYILNGLAGQSPLLDGAIIFFASYLPYVLVALLAAVLLLSSYSRRQKLEILLITGISSIIARAGVVELIRFFYHRPRPFTALSLEPLFDDAAWSFPSGHAAFFFALATALYLYNKKWGTLFFLAAGLVAVSRVIAGVHYPSDIIAGALIGGIVGSCTYYFGRKVAGNSANQTY